VTRFQIRINIIFKKGTNIEEKIPLLREIAVRNNGVLGKTGTMHWIKATIYSYAGNPREQIKSILDRINSIEGVYAVLSEVRNLDEWLAGRERIISNL